MPVFDSKSLTSNPDDLSWLSAVLHPDKQDRVEAIRRGRERLEAATSAQEAMAPRSVGRRKGEIQPA